MSIDFTAKDYKNSAARHIELTCSFCNKLYKSYENIGMWNCSYHPGLKDGNIWTCCNKLYGLPACLICDHNNCPTSYTSSSVIRSEPAVINLMMQNNAFNKDSVSYIDDSIVVFDRVRKKNR